MPSVSPSLLLIALLVAAGCDGEPASPPSDLPSIMARLEAEADPIRKLALLRELARDPSVELPLVCEALPEPSLRQECNRLSRRPHLRQPRRDAGAPPTELWGITLPAEAIGPLAEVAPVLDPSCAERQPEGRDACQALVSRTLAEEEGAQAAAAACAVIEEGRNECLFRVAEIRLRGGDAGGAVELCLASRWADRCLTHLVGDISRPVPAVAPEQAEAWRAIGVQIDAAGAAAAAAGDDLAVTLREEAWAQAFQASIGKAAEADGSFIAALPPEALPQFRAVLAWRLVRGEQDLAALVAQVVAGERGPVELGLRNGAAGSRWQGWRWPSLTEDERQLPTVSFLEGRRLFSPDPATDAAVCVLEASNAFGDVPVALLAPALVHPSPLVRWTAVRLLPPGPDGEGLQQQASVETNPLVRARLRLPRERAGGSVTGGHARNPPGPRAPPP
ncbi:MAG: hypothetical protein ABIO70_26870 [Pseudomonadota bacterium]